MITEDKSSVPYAMGIPSTELSTTVKFPHNSGKHDTARTRRSGRFTKNVYAEKSIADVCMSILSLPSCEGMAQEAKNH